jgi:tetratricopeptide (TPR) repeat protein
MSTKKGPPEGGGKVVSIVAELGRRRAQQDRKRAAVTHLRQLESSAEMAEHAALLEDLDFEAGFAELESDPSPEARANLAMLRGLHAFRSCTRGDTAAGFAEWDEIIAAAPELASPYMIRAYWWTRSDPARAIADYDRAVTVEPQNANVYARRGDCYHALEDDERALANYRRALTLDPKLFDTHCSMAAVLAGRGDHEGALASYDKAIRLAPQYVEFHLGRAASLESLGRLDRAIADYDRVLELDPSREDVRSHRFQCLVRAGQGDRAAEEAAKRIEGALPDDPEALTLIGTLHHVKGRHEEAIETLSRALALAPDHVPALVKRGDAYYATGDYELGLADFDRAAALAPDDAKLHEGRGNTLAKLERMEEAVAALSRTIELMPDNAGAHALRGIYRSHVEETDEGIARVKADLQRAIEISPTEIVYVGKLGEWLADRWELEEALEVYERAIAAMPDRAELYYQRAYCRSQMIYGRRERDLDDHETEEEKRVRCTSAIADLEKAIELGKANEDVYFELVRVQEQLGGEAEKLAMLDRGIEALPDFVILRALRHSWRLHRGDVAGAAADHARLLELGFQFPDN